MTPPISKNTISMGTGGMLAGRWCAQRVEGHRGGGGDVQRVDAGAHGDPHPQLGRLQPATREPVALAPQRERQARV